MSCLELWTGAVCAYSSEPDFQPLAYPLTQIISGVARMVPTARYFPLRLRCARMLNRIAASTGMFVPISFLLLDMLEMKELNTTGGVGKAVDLRTLLKVQKPVLKTRAFQEACVFSVMEELAEHLSQWSYSIAFFELAFIPTVRLRSICKTTKIERFRRELRELIRQIEANSEFTNARRMAVSFLPNDPAATSFLEAEKESGASPLSQYVVTLRQRAQQRSDSMVESSVIVGAHASIFGRKKSETDDEDNVQDEEEGAAVFSSSWLPGSNTESENPKQVKTKKRKRQREQQKEVALDEDVVEDLVLSSDEDESISDTPSAEEENKSTSVSSKQGTQKQKSFKDSSKNKGHFRAKKPKKRKRAKQANLH